MAAIHDGGGDLLIADPAAGLVGIVRDGALVGTLPEPRGVSGWRPDSIGRGVDGTVLVGDAGAGRIDRFGVALESPGDRSGNRHGSSAGEWRWIESVDLGTVRGPVSPIAVGETRRGVLFVDGAADRVFEVSSGGREGDSRERRELDGDGIPGGWGRPTDLVVAADGRIFVTDADRHRVLRFDAEGRFLGAFGERGPFPGLFQDPVGLDLAGDRLYVSDRLNHRISIFDLEGRSRGQWGMHAVIPREGEGRIHYPVDVAIAPDAGAAAVVEPFERRVQLFDAADQSDAGPGTVAELPSLDGVTSHFGAGVAADGDLVVLWEPETAAVVVFDWRGEVPIHVSSFGGPGTSADRFGRVTAAAVDDASQRIALADPGLDRLAFVDLDRNPEAGLRLDPFMARTAGTVSFERIEAQIAALAGRSDTPPIEPVDLAWSGDGGLLLLEKRLGRVVSLAPMPSVREGHLPLPSEVTAVWGPGGTGGGAFVEPIAMSLSPEGDAVAVLDAGGPAGPARVAVLSLDGIPRGGFELPRMLHSLDEHPIAPGGLAWTETGFAISDRLSDRLMLFDDSGVLRHEVGTTGTADGELWSPQGLAIRDDGTVVVVDTGNHRVQGFSADDASWRVVFSLGRASTRQRPPGPPGANE